VSIRGATAWRAAAGCALASTSEAAPRISHGGATPGVGMMAKSGNRSMIAAM
jgi:hypothetical protein